MYRDGEGVLQDSVAAHMWLSLAATWSSGNSRETFVAARDEIAAQMAPEQIAEAQRFARE